MSKYNNTIILIKWYSIVNKVIGLQKLTFNDKAEIIPVGILYKIYNVLLTIVVSCTMSFSLIKFYANLKTVSVVHKFTILIAQGSVIVTYCAIMLPCAFSDPKILLKFQKTIMKIETMLGFDKVELNKKFVIYLIKSYGSYVFLKFIYLYLSRNLRFWLLHFCVITIELESLNMNLEMSLVSRRLEFFIEKIKNLNKIKFIDFDIKHGILIRLWKEKYDFEDEDLEIAKMLKIHDCLCKCIELINDRFSNKVYTRRK